MENEQLNLINTRVSEEKEKSKPPEEVLPVVNPLASLENSLSAIFPTNSEENKIVATRRQLGESGKAFTDEQISSIITEFQYLIDTWLSEFEKEVFSGKTLIQLLSDKEYGTIK